MGRDPPLRRNQTQSLPGWCGEKLAQGPKLGREMETLPTLPEKDDPVCLIKAIQYRSGQGFAKTSQGRGSQARRMLCVGLRRLLGLPDGEAWSSSWSTGNGGWRVG